MRHEIRSLFSSPGFTAATVLTLAPGIGATTAIFSVADAVLLRPLPYPKSDRLVMVRDELSKMGVHYNDVSYDTYEAYRRNSSFDASAAFTEEDTNLVAEGRAERVSVIASTPGLFDMLGAGTALGRLFENQDGNPAVLSYALFSSRFSSNPAIIGHTIRLDSGLYTVVGVMTPSFTFGLSGQGAEVWIPLASMKDPRVWQFHLLARMRPGVDIAAAQVSMTDTAKHVDATVRPYRGPNGEDGGYQARVFSVRSQLLGDFRTGSLLLLATTGLLLLIACVNVANLLLVRAAGREKETAIRRALGASGIRLVRQWMSEAAVLTVIGGAAGLVISYWGIWLLKILIPAELPGSASIDIDGRVLLFTFGLSGIVCAALSLAPLMVTQPGSLRGPRRSRGMANWLVVTEVAVAIVLLIGCGLLAKSFARLRQVDTGLRTDHVLTMRIQLSGPSYREARQRIRFFSELQERMKHLPGVISASEVNMLPVFTVGVDTRNGNPFSTEDRPWDPNSATRQMAHTMSVGTDYFRTMGISMLKGRDFSRRDGMEASPVAIVNKTLERKFFPRGALGERILFGAPEPGVANRWMTIVGVISDVRTGALDLPAPPQFYRPAMQDPDGGTYSLVLRTQGDAGAMSRAALALVKQLDPEQPVAHVMTMEQHVGETLGQPRFRAMLVSLFASLALFLAAVGIYGVVAHAVTQRTREIGIRGALGANARRIATAVLADGMKPIGLGIAIGMVGSAILNRLLAGILYEVKPDDAATFGWSIVMIVAIGAAACLMPALAAARVDPVSALRAD